MLRSKRKTGIKFNNPFFGLLQFLLTHKSLTWHIFMSVKNYIQRMLPRYLKLRWKWLVIIMSRGTVWNCHSLSGAGRKCKAVAAVLLSTSSPFYKLISSRKGETGDKICKELTHKGIDCSLKKKIMKLTRDIIVLAALRKTHYVFRRQYREMGLFHICGNSKKKKKNDDNMQVSRFKIIWIYI